MVRLPFFAAAGELHRGARAGRCIDRHLHIEREVVKVSIALYPKPAPFPARRNAQTRAVYESEGDCALISLSFFMARKRALWKPCGIRDRGFGGFGLGRDRPPKRDICLDLLKFARGRQGKGKLSYFSTTWQGGRSRVNLSRLRRKGDRTAQNVSIGPKEPLMTSALQRLC